jgi:hypothetical protein
MLKRLITKLVIVAVAMVGFAGLSATAAQATDNVGTGQTATGLLFNINAYTPTCNSQLCASYSVIGQTWIPCLTTSNPCHINSVTSYSKAQLCAQGKSCSLTGSDWVAVGTWHTKRCPTSGTPCYNASTTAVTTFDCSLTNLYEPYIRTIAKSWVVDSSGSGRWGPTNGNINAVCGPIEGSARLITNCAGYGIPLNPKNGWMPHMCFSAYAIRDHTSPFGDSDG